MADIKVSVVIPVYNTRDYVEETVRSIMGQTLPDIEIIVINDGSTDDSLAIVQSLAAQDHRIRIYSQENKGLSNTRNLGIRLARGEYIYFMDSDDLLEKKALAECHEKCKADDLDFVFFDADIFGESISTLDLNYHRTHLVKDTVYSGLSLLEHFFEVGGYQPSACLSFVNRSFLEKNKLTFYPGILHEDELFTFFLYINAERVGCIKKAYFKRRLRINSIMVNKFSHKSLEGYVTVVSQLVKLKKEKKDDKISKLVDRRITEILGGVLYNSRAMKANDRYLLLLKCMIKFKKYVKVKDLILLTFPISRYLKNVASTSFSI